MEKTMTPPDLVTLLDLVALALGRVADGSTTPISDLSEAAAGIAQVRAALLASPPEAPADLVALWSEYREAFQVDPEEQEDDGPRYQRLVKAHRALLDWTPPAASGPPSGGPIPLNDAQQQAAKEWAADDRLWTTQETVEINLRAFARKILAASGPPAAPPETVKECAWLVETHILSHLHYLRSWNVRHSKPEWTSNIDEAWRFARREDADKALVYLAAGEGRVAEHLWVPLHAPPVVVPEAPAPPEIDTPEVRRAD